MAQEIFFDTDLQLVFSPLDVSYGITVEGNVADVQGYDQSDGTYSPNYTQAYCVLKPWMRVTDPDGIIPDGEVQMTNMHWYVYDGAATAEISNGTDYQIDAQGRLSIRKNLGPGTTLRFRFTGEYVDTRKNEVWRMEDAHDVRCEAESERPVLDVNHKGLVEWDPTTGEPSKVVVRADLMMGGLPVPAANCELIWRKKDVSEGDTAYSQILHDSDPDHDAADYDVELAADSRSLVVRRDLMGLRIDLQVWAKYDAYGSPASKALDDSSPLAEVTFTRNIPKPEPKVLMPTEFAPGQTTCQPQLDVYIGDRLIENPEKWWHFYWYLSTGVASGAVTRKLVAEGVKPTLPLSYLSRSYGATLSLGVKERDPLAGLVQGGFLLTKDGAVLLA